MKVGDLIRIEDCTGIVCEIERSEELAPGRENRFWTIWEDGEYSWISEEDYAEIINESR